MIIFFTKGLFINIFDISVEQRKLLSSILALYFIYLLVSLIDSEFFEIIRLKNNIKLYRKSLILFYLLLIMFDFIAFILTKSLINLYIATIAAHIINIIYLAIKFNLKYERITRKNLYYVKKYGITLSLERLLSRRFILIYGVLASYIKEKDYAIHSICYGVCLNLEIITDAYSTLLMIKIPEERDKNKQLDLLKNYMSKCFIVILVINFILAIITLIIQHGSLPIKECFPYIIFYCCTIFGLFFYESYKAVCVIQGKTKTILKGSIIGAIVRVLVCMLFLRTPICLYIFGIASFIDFNVRSIIYKIDLNNI